MKWYRFYFEHKDGSELLAFYRESSSLYRAVDDIKYLLTHNPNLFGLSEDYHLSDVTEVGIDGSFAWDAETGKELHGPVKVAKS